MISHAIHYANVNARVICTEVWGFSFNSVLRPVDVNGIRIHIISYKFVLYNTCIYFKVHFFLRSRELGILFLEFVCHVGLNCGHVFPLVNLFFSL